MGRGLRLSSNHIAQLTGPREAQATAGLQPSPPHLLCQDHAAPLVLWANALSSVNPPVKLCLLTVNDVVVFDASSNN